MLRENTEIEYKCLVSENEYLRLLKYYEKRFEEIKQVNIYYTDLLQNLSNQEAILRQRLYDTTSVLGFKIKVADKLLEYESAGATLDNPEFLEILAKYDIRPPFIKIGELLTVRRLIDFENAELCLDENHYNDIVDYEIEYELKNQNADLSTFITLLKKVNIPYQANPLSKYQRLLSSQNSL